MKRKVVALLTAIMVLAMGTMTVSAANVPSGENNGENQEEVKAPEVKETKALAASKVKLPSGLTLGDLAETAKEDAAACVKSLTADPENLESLVDGTDLADVKEIKVSYVVLDINGPENGGSYTIGFPGKLTSKAVVYAIPMDENGNTGMPVKATKVEGSNVTITFPHFSTYILLALDDTTSPGTGEEFPIAATAMAVICLAGVVVCGRKVKFN